MRRVLAVAAVCLAALTGLAAWLLWSESGLRATLWALERVSEGRVRAEGASGRLAGPLALARLAVDTPDLSLEVHGLALEWRPEALAEGRLVVPLLALERLRIAAVAAGDASPLVAPEHLILPLALEIPSLRVRELEIVPAAEGSEVPVPWRASDLELGLESDGRDHQIDVRHTALPFGRAVLSAHLDGAAQPFTLQAQGRLEGAAAGRDYHIEFAAAGDLLAPQLAATVITGEGAGAVAAVLAPFDPIPLRELHVTLRDIDPAVFDAAWPRARLTVEARLRAEADAGPLGWRLEGPFTLRNAQVGGVDRGGLPIERGAARLSWTPEQLALAALSVELPGRGRVGGELVWRVNAGDAVPGLEGRLRLDGVDPRRLDGRLPAGQLAGRAEGALGRDGGSAALDLRAGKTSLIAQLGIAPREAAAVAPRFTATGRVRGFNPADWHAGSPVGSLDFDARGDGVLAAHGPLSIGVEILPSRLHALPVQGSGSGRWTEGRLGDVVVALAFGANRLDARGSWGGVGDVLAVSADAPELAAIGKAFGVSLGGQARLDASIAGTPAEPAGSLRLYGSSLQLPGELALAGLNAQVELGAGAGGSVRAAVGLSGFGSQKDAAGKIDPWVLQAAVGVEGTRDAHSLTLDFQLRGDERVSARLEGGVGGDAGWVGRLQRLRGTGPWPLVLKEAVALEASLQRVALGPAVFDAGSRGAVHIAQAEWTPERAWFSGRLSGLVVAPEGEGASTSLRLGGEWDLRFGAALEGMARVFRESGDLMIGASPGVPLGLQNLELRLGAHENRLALAWEARGSALGELVGSATALAERDPQAGWRLAPEAALLGSARLAIPSIAWVGRLMEDHVVTGGRLDAELSLAGTPAHPQASGRIRGEDLALALVDEGLQLGGGRLDAAFDRDRLTLERLEFVSPNRARPNDRRVPVERFTREPGRLSAKGGIALATGQGHFDFEADRLPILQRADRWLILSGHGEATSTWTRLDVVADLKADAGYVELAETPAPSLSDDVVILGREPVAGAHRLALGADIGIALGEHFRLSALGVDTRLTGALRLRKRDGLPLTAVGTIATEGGTYKGYGQRLDIDRGLINFQGPADNPGLNVVALRKGLAVEAGVEISGTARRPLVRLVSQPVVPDPEKLSWIVLGRAPSAGAGGDLGLLLPAAQALLGGAGGGMTEQLSRSLGFDELSIGQGDLHGPTRTATSSVVGEGVNVRGGNLGGQVLTLGKRLSSRLSLAFEQSLGGAESLVRLTYQLTRRVSVVARGGSDNAADIYYTISFD